MNTRQLSQAEFEATLAHPMKDIRNSGGPFVDVGPYLREVPETDWRGYQMRSEIPDCIYVSPDDRYEHHLIPTTTPDVYLAIVADNLWQGFHGHRLLNFNELYGRKDPAERT